MDFIAYCQKQRGGLALQFHSGRYRIWRPPIRSKQFLFAIDFKIGGRDASNKRVRDTYSSCRIWVNHSIILPMARYPTLFIDKLAITIPLEGQRAQEVHEAVIDSAERWGDYIALASLRNRSYRGQYKFSTPEGSNAVLLLEPINRRNNYFKLEYSPNNFGEGGRALLGEYLREILGGTYLDDILSAKLTRLDVAFDVRRLRLKDLLIVDTRGGKSAIIRGGQGEPESYYFPFKGTNQLCVYDKLQETIDKQGPPPPNHKQAQWVRFEYRYRRLSRYTLGDVVGRMENPFRNFEVKQFGAMAVHINTERLRMFFDGCRMAGVESVLEEIPDSATRDRLFSAYRAFPTPAFWQRRTSIWGGLPSAIENALPR